MNVYESIIILNANLSDEAIQEATDKIKGTITGGGGEVLKVEPWGRRKLAYEINKQQKGFLNLLIYRAPSSVNKTLEGFYKVYDPVVKYMIIKLERKQREKALSSIAQEEAPSPEGQENV
jgi:small subunit ribosomal protein S6